MREGREPFFKGIEEIDEQRSAIEAEIAQIEAEAVAQQEASITYKCPKCGSNVSAHDLFCSGCGTPAAEMKASMQQIETPTGPTCRCCGAGLNEGDLFCMACGAKQG